MLIAPSATNFSESLIKMTNFSFMKIWYVKWRPFFPQGDELRILNILVLYLFTFTSATPAPWLLPTNPLMSFFCLYLSHWIQESQHYHQTTTNHFLSQFWLVMHMVLLHSPDSSFTVSAPATVLYNEFELYTFKMIDVYPWGQWVNKGQILLILFDVSIISFSMMTSWNRNINCVTAGPLWGESTAHQCIPLKKATDAELWCFYASALWRRRHYVFGLSVRPSVRPSVRSLKYPLLTCTWVHWSTRPTVTV